MMQFEGDRDVPQSPAEVWSKLSDARFLVQCMPDSEAVAHAEAAKAVCTIRPGFAFVRGTLELTVQVTEAVPEHTVRLQLHTKGMGSSSDVEATVALAPRDNGTHVHWVAEVKSLGGLLKALPQGLIKAAAQKVIHDVLVAGEGKMSA